MRRFLFSGALLFFGLFPVLGQRVPVNGDTLNFTSVLFSFPWIDGYEKFRIQVVNLQDSSVNFLYDCTTNKKLIERLAFGQSYRWRYGGLNSQYEVGVWSEYQSFHIATSDYVDPELYTYKGKRRKRGIGEAGILLMDAGRVGVSRIGRPAFFLRNGPFLNENTVVRDLKMTHNGTFTALFDSTACEFELDGTILWKAPDDGRINGETREHYHHEFTKLPTGNYVVLGLDYVQRTAADGSTVKVEFGTIIEYKSDGSIAWSWNSKDYFSDKDLFYKKSREGAYDTQTHMNACTMDSLYVYAGFRDISRLIVIEKKTGKVMASYGGNGFPQEPHSAVGFFRRQHGATRLSDGNFAVVNNDSVMDPAVVSSLVVFSPISKEQPQSKKVFEFKFDYDTLTNGKSVKTGNLIEMKNGNLFVNMGALNRCVEVTRSGEVIWDMVMDRYDTNHRVWLPAPQYRVTFTPSLYPYEHTARILQDKLMGENRKITVRVWNIGALDDHVYLRLQAPEDQPKMVHRSQDRTVASSNFVDLEFSVRELGALDIRIDGEHCRYSTILHLDSVRKY
ncbi:MAG: hypothetical protein A3D92_17065 [Bacteroidetes bacterium RIFCSPHIGHO2_02_FULL_44_7]|nr:MAG: hypothetical protein A3D92_17065 [Bacteroidetes bacterium RIFCSPHIGHO2_02_FULL_44_7]